MVDRVKPLMTAVSFAIMPIVAVIAMIGSVLILIIAPVASSEIVYPESVAMAEGDYALIKAEMEQYQGMPYEWAGDRPETSFDCSGLTAWV